MKNKKFNLLKNIDVNVLLKYGAIIIILLMIRNMFKAISRIFSFDGGGLFGFGSVDDNKTILDNLHNDKVENSRYPTKNGLVLLLPEIQQDAKDIAIYLSTNTWGGMFDIVNDSEEQNAVDVILGYNKDAFKMLEIAYEDQTTNGTTSSWSSYGSLVTDLRNIVKQKYLDKIEYLLS